MSLKDEAILYSVYPPPRCDLPFLAVTRLPTGDVSAVPFRTYEEAERHIQTIAHANSVVLNDISVPEKPAGNGSAAHAPAAALAASPPPP